LARKIRAGDAMAYGEAIDEISPLSSISHFGPSTEFTVHTPRILECVLGLSSTKVIPAESKTLTSTGKVSVKPWNTARFHEIYQDYICSCMLRVARELFALLPIEVLILTARIELLDSRTGHSSEQPVLSVALHRERLESLNFDLLDPSDTIESLLHRGDFKASRKSGAFAAITPFDLRDVRPTNLGGRDLEELVQRAKDLREEIRAAREMMSGVEN
jgi:hypothetical protein